VDLQSTLLSNAPFFVSMATAAKLFQPIPIFLAYLVPLDVDVVPNKFHQFMFGEQPAMIILGIRQFFGFLSSNFMKLCRNIHHSVWQLLGVEKKIKMAAVAMVAKVQKMLNSNVQRILLRFDTKIDHHSKLCSLFLKFSKWPPI
jgi:hypothetical protein